MAESKHLKVLREWLDDPDTSYEDWATLSYDEIALRTGLPLSAVYRHLKAVVCERGYTGQAFDDARRVEYLKKSNRLSDGDIERLRVMRSEDPPRSYDKCAADLGISRNAVMKRCKKMGLDTPRKKS